MKRKPVKSASRTFEVLELFRDRRQPLRLNEIYSALGYPQSSTTNLLKSMVIEGYLNYNRATRTYLPTLQVASLGSWLYGHIASGSGYTWLIDELFRLTDETVVLVTQNDLFIQYMMMRVPDHPHKRPPNPGEMRLMLDATSGMALMSQMRDREIDKIYRYSNYYELNPDRRITLEDVMRRIRWIRHTGYCYWPEHPVPGIASIAMSLGESIHGIPLVLGIGGTTERLSKRRAELVDLMRGKIAEFRHRFMHDDGLPDPQVPFDETDYFLAAAE
ncbi:IclR family transcriptional regulator [Sphingomonas colocasiae]|uniref:Helix-turn-helix domain-containing protein n=1 Tax=Sphingomonas colocasiae TaxID=1848973 RepID=A0ABS7PMU2_9SPHN|nr:helix-turn-helix domain-containing protein [Sphingomonas colocasiae]MBY8822635.1 helix-turn-helix domain-containing protein [Sphingomonas colocasiae]